ncbi:MAG: hypothetical protein V3U50_05110 [Acidimicrobiia bacterium]
MTLLGALGGGLDILTGQPLLRESGASGFRSVLAGPIVSAATRP